MEMISVKTAFSAAPNPDELKMRLKGISVTSGGIIGSIVSIGDDETLILRVKPDNIKIQVSRSAVTGLVTKEPPK